MLIEINLLPQKEQKKYTFIMILAVLIIVFLLAGGLYLYKINAAKSDISNISRQVDMTQKVVAKIQQSGQSAEASSSASQLKNAITWANSYPIQTIPVMNHLSSLLPARGFIQSFSYTDAGTVSLTVQFDSERDAAYFLENLNKSKWITDVSLSSLTAVKQADSTAAAGTNTVTGQATTTGTNGTTGSQTTGDAATNNQTSNTAAAQTGTLAQKSSVNTTIGTSAAGAALPAAGTAATDPAASNILPRYTGQFQITLNRNAIQQLLHKGKSNGEGVAGS